MKRTFLLIGTCMLLVGLSETRGQGTINATGGSQIIGTTSYDWSIGEVSMVSTFYNSKIVVTQGLLQNELSTPQKVLNTELAKNMQVFPNPTTSVVNLQYTSATAGTLKYRLMDMAGKVVLTHSSEVKQGVVTEQMNIANLANASYMLEVTFNDRNNSFAVSSYKIEKLN